MQQNWNDRKKPGLGRVADLGRHRVDATGAVAHLLCLEAPPHRRDENHANEIN